MLTSTPWVRTLDGMRFLLPIAVLALAAASWPAHAGTQDDIHRVIGAHRRALVRCYQRELKRDPAVAEGGRVVLDFFVGDDGIPRGIRTSKQSTLRHEPLERCLIEEFRTMRFPENQETHVAYSLFFRG